MKIKQVARPLHLTIPLTFEFNVHKFVNAMSLFAGAITDLTKLKAMKLFFFADKEHLINHAAPILGDTYLALTYGPVPSIAKEIMDEKERPSTTDCDAEYLKLFDEHVELAKSLFHPYPRYRQKKQPDMGVFSNSELTVLNDIIKKYGQMSAHKLVDITHEEACYKQTRKPGVIDYRLFFDGPNGAGALELVEIIQEDRKLEDLLNT